MYVNRNWETEFFITVKSTLNENLKNLSSTKRRHKTSTHHSPMGNGKDLRSFLFLSSSFWKRIRVLFRLVGITFEKLSNARNKCWTTYENQEFFYVENKTMRSPRIENLRKSLCWFKKCSHFQQPIGWGERTNRKCSETQNKKQLRFLKNQSFSCGHQFFCIVSKLQKTL